MVKILILSVSAWNSKVGADTWPVLVSGHDPQNIANICLREEAPDSDACSNYFVISENKILKSFFNRRIKTGYPVQKGTMCEDSSQDLKEHNRRYEKMRRHRGFLSLSARELVWEFGRWKTPELDRFLLDFNPTVILYSMDGYIHFNRLCLYAKKLTGAKSIGFFVDDNFTYRQSSRMGDQFFRFFQRRSLKKVAKHTDAFFAITDMTKQEADQTFGIDCVVLTKPLNREPVYIKSTYRMPIRILYTGNLQIGRDRSLVKLVNVLKRINQDEVRFVVDVYTKTTLSEEVERSLDSSFCNLYPPVSQSEVLEMQRRADVLLFLEDVDGPDAKVARLSFSTKITDYLSSGKCILAIGCADTAPMRYLTENQAALTATKEDDIELVLQQIVNDPHILNEYAQRACELGIRNHSKEKILQAFNDTIRNTISAG